jgi:DNA-binding GntR family transcriptional regulator
VTAEQGAEGREQECNDLEHARRIVDRERIRTARHSVVLHPLPTCTALSYRPAARAADGDVERAASAMAEHIDYAKQQVLRVFFPGARAEGGAA